MAITKILARHARMDVCVEYVLNGAKTNEKIYTAYHDVTEDNPYLAMKAIQEQYADRRRNIKNEVACYHIIQSFEPGEVSPEQALEIAKEFCAAHLNGFQAVIGTHVDRNHVHNHICFNSVNKYTGYKYHSSPESYLRQIRGISDRLCEKYGLSVIMHGEKNRAVKYVEWLREQRGQPTYRSMLTADLEQAVASAADYGHFLVLMEHMGYEVKHGSRLSFRLRGTENFIVPGRRDARFTETGIRAGIASGLEAAAAGLRPALPNRRPYIPFRSKGKLRGLLALYVHYLYLLGSIRKQEYPPKMTPEIKAEIMKFERYKAHYAFLRKNGIESAEQLEAHRASIQAKLSALMKRRTILNVKKRKQKPLFDTLATAEALRPARELYASGVAGIESEFVQYMDAVETLEKSGVPLETLKKEKTELYGDLADVNSEIRQEKRNMELCDEILKQVPRLEQDIQTITKQKEVVKDHAKRR